ncbi:hypothetical protein MKEN_00165600 [Mycena kentingensis (nom. inval.)]|nr:hypothetical protein MKEN_00165600 [Mycena kentingensis (nom. inval.)]
MSTSNGSKKAGSKPWPTPASNAAQERSESALAGASAGVGTSKQPTGKLHDNSNNDERMDVEKNVLDGDSESSLTPLDESDSDFVPARMAIPAKSIARATPQSSSAPRRNKSGPKSRAGNRQRNKKTVSSVVDVFGDAAEQVSEADIKRAVESLNETVDVVVASLLDKITGFYAPALDTDVAPVDIQQMPIANELVHSKLCTALSECAYNAKQRKTILDAILHHILVAHLQGKLFAGMVLPEFADPAGVVDNVFRLMVAQEPWMVSQRWRALSATHANTDDINVWVRETAAAQTNLILALLSYTSPSFETQLEQLGPGLNSQLVDLHNEAQALAMAMRRDILSVRMFVHCVGGSTPCDALFDPWPQMGSASDEVLGLYHFGLSLQAQKGPDVCRVRPRAITSSIFTLLESMAA